MMSDRLPVAGSRLSMFTPMPPARTGVAHYASMLIPALQKHAEVEVITDDRQPATGHRIYQLGNNPHHEWIYKQAIQHPGVIVLHDIVLHHLIVEMTLARGDAAGYIAALEANHGAVGAAWGRGRAPFCQKCLEILGAFWCQIFMQPTMQSTAVSSVA